jgi:hypothetical protein
MGEEGGVEVFLHVELQDGTRHTVFPSLLAKLQCYAGFRPRNASTLMTLRHLALEWAKASRLRWIDVQQGMFGSVALGAVVSSSEHSAVDTLRRLAPDSLSSLS